MMGWKRGLGIGCGGLIALVAIGGGWLWYAKPWVPPVEVAAPAEGGTRVTENGMTANFYQGSGEGPRPALLLFGGSEGGIGGGKVIAKGTPEEVAQTDGSYTGDYLRKVLRKKHK